MKRKHGGVNRRTGIVGVREVGTEQQKASAALVDDLYWQAVPTRLPVLNHVEQERSVWKFSILGIVGTVIHPDFDAFLSERATVVVREAHFQFFTGGVPSNEVRTGGGDEEVRERGLGVEDMAHHADSGAQVAHDGGHRTGRDDRSSVSEFKQFLRCCPTACLATAVHRSRANVIIAGSHGADWRDEIFPPFLC